MCILPGKLQKRKWENAMTLDKQSWGFRRRASLSDILTMEEILATFASTVRCVCVCVRVSVCVCTSI